MLREWDFDFVRGNHEDMLRLARVNEDYLMEIDRRYGSGLRVALEVLDQSDLDWLSSLPHPLAVEFEGCKILLCHGAYWDFDFYVYPDAHIELLECCAVPEYDLVVLKEGRYSEELHANHIAIGRFEKCHQFAGIGAKQLS